MREAFFEISISETSATRYGNAHEARVDPIVHVHATDKTFPTTNPTQPQASLLNGALSALAKHSSIILHILTRSTLLGILTPSLPFPKTVATVRPH